MARYDNEDADLKFLNRLRAKRGLPSFEEEKEKLNQKNKRKPFKSMRYTSNGTKDDGSPY